MNMNNVVLRERSLLSIGLLLAAIAGLVTFIGKRPAKSY